MPTHYPDGTPIGTQVNPARTSPRGVGRPVTGRVTGRPAAAHRLPTPPAAALPQPPARLVAALHGQVDLAAYAVAAAAARPWGDGDPITWAVRTGRILIEGAEQWRTHVQDDPAVNLPILAALEPVLGPQVANATASATASGPRADDEDCAQFDELYPPHMRYGPQDDTLDPALAEFDGLYPPNLRYGPDAFGLTEDEYQARLGGH